MGNKGRIMTLGECLNFLRITRYEFDKKIKIRLKPIMYGAETYYYWDEVNEKRSSFVAERILSNYHNPQTIYGTGNTDSAVKTFMELVNPDEVLKVRIYFHWDDSILDGYYVRRDNDNENKKRTVDSPTLIVTLNDNREMWFRGLLCGYIGAGPNASLDVLSYIGISGDDIKNALYNSCIIEFYRKHGNWCYETIIPKYDITDKLNRCGSFFSVEDKLVFAFTTEEHIFPDEDIFHVFMNDASEFMPRPDKVEIMSRDVAIENGYFKSHLNKKITYQIVFRDSFGREVWVPCIINSDKAITKQTNIQELLSYYGFDMKADRRLSLKETFRVWLQQSSFSVIIDNSLN